MECTLEGHKGKDVTEVAFSSTGRRVATGSVDGTVRIWGRLGEKQSDKTMSLLCAFDTRTKRWPGANKNPPKITGVAWTCDDRFVVVASEESVAFVRSLLHVVLR